MRVYGDSVDAGCTRLKVISESSNAVARALYAGAGFRVTDVSRVWRYRPGDEVAGRRKSKG